MSFWNAEIVAVGSELLTPFRVDTNSLYLTEQLNTLGIAVVGKQVVGDDGERLTEALRAAFLRSRLTVVTGGLGPTTDDLTRECSAAALGVGLQRSAVLVADLEAFFRTRAPTRKMPASNLRQADLVEGAEALANPHGTAPGQWWASADRVLVLLPGPPRELRPMVENEVLPRLRRIVTPGALATRVLMLAERPESEVDGLAAPIYARYPDVESTILTTLPGQIELHFRASGASPAAAQARADTVAEEVAAVFGTSVFSHHGATLEAVVGGLLRERGESVAVAESCTGGLLGGRLTSVPGASQFFRGGLICYHDELKTGWGGVSPATLAAHGAVSEATACELAAGARLGSKADWGVAITGIAGPDGGTPEKPVGLVFIGIAGPEHPPVAVRREFWGERERIRGLSTQAALNRLRLTLAGGL